jgi:molybdate transport system ATP-binding protein
MSLVVKFIKQFDGFKSDMEFSIGNELLVLFGPSGAGKSVTLRFIAGLIIPDEGFLKLNGRELFDLSRRINVRPQDRSVGFVFQNHSLFPHMTVLENIFFGAKGVEKIKALNQVNAILESFHLKGIEYKYPHQISGGQQQRVALAMNLIRKPAALLLDEPFSALDSELRGKMRELLVEIKQQFNIPIIVVTHDLDEANAIADKILFLKNGTITN